MLMFPEERHQQILKVLHASGSVKVNELSEVFNVTLETIRRDLEKLEAKNKLKRTHGGAILVQEQMDDDDIPFKVRERLNKAEKINIAKAAVQLIDEGDHIYIDAGSTSLYLAKAMPNIDLTIVTNSLLVAFELSKRKKIRIILTGGDLIESSFSIVGWDAIRSIQQYNVKKMFYSCKGFDKEWGVSDSNQQQAAVKKAVMERAEQVILLLDSSKTAKRSFVYINAIDEIDSIVVDAKSDLSYFQGTQFKDIKIIKSSDS